jgi:hypothetical protein
MVISDDPAAEVSEPAPIVVVDYGYRQAHEIEQNRELGLRRTIASPSPTFQCAEAGRKRAVKWRRKGAWYVISRPPISERRRQTSRIISTT